MPACSDYHSYIIIMAEWPNDSFYMAGSEAAPAAKSEGCQPNHFGLGLGVGYGLGRM